jgi:hypothetical protein
VLDELVLVVEVLMVVEVEVVLRVAVVLAELLDDEDDEELPEIPNCCE